MSALSKAIFWFSTVFNKSV